VAGSVKKYFFNNRSGSEQNDPFPIPGEYVLNVDGSREPNTEELVRKRIEINGHRLIQDEEAFRIIMGMVYEWKWSNYIPAYFSRREGYFPHVYHNKNDWEKKGMLQGKAQIKAERVDDIIDEVLAGRFIGPWLQKNMREIRRQLEARPEKLQVGSSTYYASLEEQFWWYIYNYSGWELQNNGTQKNGMALAEEVLILTIQELELQRNDEDLARSISQVFSTTLNAVWNARQYLLYVRPKGNRRAIPFNGDSELKQVVNNFDLVRDLEKLRHLLHYAYHREMDNHYGLPVKYEGRDGRRVEVH
jgi:hypothetical protein